MMQRWSRGPIACRYETFYDDAVDAVDELRGTGTAPDGAPDAAATTEVTSVSHAGSHLQCCGDATAPSLTAARSMAATTGMSHACAQFIIVDPDTGVEVDEEETILMEDVAATSTSTSSSSSSSSGSDEGSDEDDGDAGADSEPRPKQTRAGIPADETAFADSSTAYKPAKPSVCCRPCEHETQHVNASAAPQANLCQHSASSVHHAHL